MDNNVLQQLELGRVFVPDAAQYWSTLYSGFTAAGLFPIIHALGYVLLVVGFVLALYNALLSQNFSAMGGVLLRLVIAAAVIGGWNGIKGNNTNDGLAWRTYHAIYAATYGSKDCSQSNAPKKECASFYNKWVRDQVASTFKDIRAALLKLFSMQVSTAALSGVTSSLFQLIDNPLTKAVGTFIAKVPKPGPAAVATAGASAAFGAVKGITDEINRLLTQVKEQISSAMRNLLIVFLVLAGLHALIVYGTITILAMAVFFMPIFTGLWLFRGLDRGFPTVIGVLLATLIALPISAIMTGTMAVMVFGVTKERVQNWLPTSDEIEEQQMKLATYNKMLPEIQRDVLARQNEMEKNSKALKGLVEIWNNRCAEGLETACETESKLKDTTLDSSMFSPTPKAVVLYEVGEEEKEITLSNGKKVTIKVPEIAEEKEIADLGSQNREGLSQLASQLETRADDIEKAWGAKVSYQVGSLVDSVFNYITNQVIKIGLGIMILTTATLVMTGIMTALTIFAVSRVIMLTSDFNIGSAINPGMLPIR